MHVLYSENQVFGNVSKWDMLLNKICFYYITLCSLINFIKTPLHCSAGSFRNPKNRLNPTNGITMSQNSLCFFVFPLVYGTPCKGYIVHTLLSNVCTCDQWLENEKNPGWWHLRGICYCTPSLAWHSVRFLQLYFQKLLACTKQKHSSLLNFLNSLMVL